MQEEAERNLSQASVDIRQKDVQLARVSKELHQASPPIVSAFCLDHIRWSITYVQQI